RDHGGDYQDFVKQRVGKLLLDIMREQVASLIRAESGLRDELNQTAQRTTQVVVNTSITAALVLGALAALFLRGELVGLSRRYTAALRDVEARSEELRTEREWFRGTLSSIGDAVIATDTRGHVVFMNDVARALTGWPQDEAVGRPLDTIFA